MVEQEWMNGGMMEAAKAHNSPVLQELERINQRCALEAAQKAQVIKYAEPSSNGVEPYKSAAEAITDLVVTLAKPAIVLSIVSGVVWVVFSGFVAIAGAILAFTSANAIWIGGVGFVVVFLFVSLASFFRSGDEGYKDFPPPPNDGGKYEWYQEQNQRQGWRKV